MRHRVRAVQMRSNFPRAIQIKSYFTSSTWKRRDLNLDLLFSILQSSSDACIIGVLIGKVSLEISVTLCNPVSYPLALSYQLMIFLFITVFVGLCAGSYWYPKWPVSLLFPPGAFFHAEEKKWLFLWRFILW